MFGQNILVFREIFCFEEERGSPLKDLTCSPQVVIDFGVQSPVLTKGRNSEIEGLFSRDPDNTVKALYALLHSLLEFLVFLTDLASLFIGYPEFLVFLNLGIRDTSGQCLEIDRAFAFEWAE